MKLSLFLGFLLFDNVSGKPHSEKVRTRRSGSARGKVSGKSHSERLRTQRSRNARGKVCDRGSRLMFAVQCQDGTEKLVCAPRGGHVGASDMCSASNPKGAEVKCSGNGGFEQVLPYYTGCYPKSMDFWESYAPDIAFAGHHAVCGADIPVPPLNLANLDFEDSDLGIGEWDQTALGGDRYVRQKCDKHPRCDTRENCKAYEGSCFGYISAGNSKHTATAPNAIQRNDFRIPEVDEAACGSSTPKFCFSFAMRFISNELENASENEKDDFFTVEVQVNDDGEMLFERTIRSSEVEPIGKDSGWIVVEVELPQVPLGEPTYFTFRAMTTNVGDYALDSDGYVDALNISPCK